MAKRSPSITFTWEGTDNPNDPSGVAVFCCDDIKVSVALNDFVTASRLSHLIYTAYEKGRSNAFDKMLAKIPRFLDEQRHE